MTLLTQSPPNNFIQQSGQPPYGQKFKRVMFGEAQKNSPKIAVIDSTPEPSEDIDGDGIADLSHGETIRRIILSFLPDSEVLLRLANPNNDIHPDGLGIPIANELKWCQDNGVEYVNISLSHRQSYRDTQVNNQSLTPRELSNYAAGLANVFKAATENFTRAIGWCVQTIEDVSDNVKIFVSAPNTFESFNVYNLAKGADHIGGMNARFEPLTGFDQNGLLTCYAQGVFNVSKVSGGYDITGNGIADVKDAEVSGKGKAKSRFTRFNGKSLGSVMLSKEQFEDLKSKLENEEEPDKIMSQYQTYLFTAEQLIALDLVSPDYRVFFDQFGDYVSVLGDKFQAGYRVNEQGLVMFDPDGSGREAVSVVQGNSFATPVALAQAAGGELKQML